MYGVLLLAALCAAEESVGHGKPGCPPPVYDGGGYPGYHNRGGWGRPYGGYAWPGYSCPDYAHIRPVVTLPPEPLVVPPPSANDPNKDDEDDEDAPKDRDDGDSKPKKSDKSDKGEDDKGEEDDRPKKSDKPDKGKKSGGDKSGKEEVSNGNVKIASAGVTVMDLNAGMKNALRYSDDDDGALIVLVSRGGPASRAALQSGMLIQQVNRVPVKTAKDVARAIDKASLADGISLRVLDQYGNKKTVRLGD